MKYQTLFLLSLFLCLSLPRMALSTPVIVWSNRDHKLSSGTYHYLGRDVSFSSFDYHVLRSFMKETPDVIFVFLTSPLTLDDITKYGDVDSSDGNSCIHNTKTAIYNSASSLFIDEVTTGPISILNNLKNSLSDFKDYSIVELVSNEELSDNLKIHDRSIVIITSAYPSLQESLMKTDEQISSFLQVADEKNLNYVSMLLGDDKPPKMHSLRAARDVTTPVPSASTSSSNTTLQYIALTNDSAILFRAQNISVVMNRTAGSNNTYYLFPNNTEYSTAFSGNDTDTYLEISTTALGNETMWLKFIFPTGNSVSNSSASLGIPLGYWSMYLNVTLSSNQTQAFSLFSLKYQLIVPFGFSYHCTPTLRFTNNTANSTDMMITISGLQVQPYKVANDSNGVYKFSSADDCIGYFTIDIWMGIFASFIIFSLLYCAIMATMGISTSDRLDDPQGKPLMVEGTSH